MVKQLPIVKNIETGKEYYVDWRLRQLRNVDNPHDFINFKNDDDMATHLAVYLGKEV